MGRDSKYLTGGRRVAFLITFLFVTITLVGSGYWVLNFVRGRTVAETTDRQVGATGDVVAMEDALSPIYINYIVRTDSYVSPESYVAMAAYVQQNAETQNAQVLVGLAPIDIVGYMMNHVASGLGVDCTHCHDLNNFASDEWDDETAMANKAKAREHLIMAADLNQNWLTQLPALSDQKQPSGAQITCATCHNGQPQPEPWPAEQAALPDDYRLPLNNIDVLLVNARDDISLDTVQYNQHTMYHMNTSLGVGCTHCHNSRYFPSWERPAKDYSLMMLQMSEYIWNTYGDTFNGKEPSCVMCHQGKILPPGAAVSADVMPAALVPADSAVQ
ncbi:MAG: photosynthetic reaction center cytochrome c subunit [Caldilineaceae bacterium]|nr:photosynthetic reaction center cytochrome c subunit [Caldilineaceae bacterium]